MRCVCFTVHLGGNLRSRTRRFMEKMIHKAMNVYFRSDSWLNMTHSCLLATKCEYFGEFLQHFFYVNCPTTRSITCISCSFKYPPTRLLLKVCTHSLLRLFLNMFFIFSGNTCPTVCILYKVCECWSYLTLRGDASVCLALISNKQAFPLMFVSARCSHWRCWYLLLSVYNLFLLTFRLNWWKCDSYKRFWYKCVLMPITAKGK